MTTRRNIRREIIALLETQPDGMTMTAIAEGIGAGYENVRTTMQRSRPPGVYVAGWAQLNRGPLTAIYKLVGTPEDAPHPYRTPTPIEASRYFREITKTRTKEIPAQGLTKIRGPWPTHH